MTTMRAVAFATLIVLFGLTVAPVGVALEGGSTGTDDSKPMGAEVSGFMQSTAADSSSSVDARMFVAAYENADEDGQSALATDRTDQLEERLESLEVERDELRDQKDELNPVAYDARMSRLAVQIGGLEQAIDDTEPRAVRAGVDPERFETLRNQTANASGPEVAAAATGLAGVEPPRGPPEHAANGTGGPPADDEDDERGGGPPVDDDDRGGGPPADDDDAERGGGPPDDAQGGDGGQPDDPDRNAPSSSEDDGEAADVDRNEGAAPTDDEDDTVSSDDQDTSDREDTSDDGDATDDGDAGAE